MQSLEAKKLLDKGKKRQLEPSQSSESGSDSGEDLYANDYVPPEVEEEEVDSEDSSEDDATSDDSMMKRMEKRLGKATKEAMVRPVTQYWLTGTGVHVSMRQTSQAGLPKRAEGRGRSGFCLMGSCADALQGEKNQKTVSVSHLDSSIRPWPIHLGGYWH